MDLLSKFIEGKTLIIEGKIELNAQIVHYYNEIIRYWNKLNFIVNKTIRSLPQNSKARFYRTELLIFVTYRLIFENTPIQTILKELNLQVEFIPFLERLQTFSWKIALNGKNKFEKLSIKEAIPSFLIEHLLPVMKFGFLKDNIKTMNQYTSQKAISFRINVLSSNISLQALITSIRKDFDKINLEFSQDPKIHFIFHTSIKNKRKIIFSDWYKNGVLIFQDKASAAITYLLNPNPDEFICDMCSAPGIKSSLMAQLSNNKARIVCNDFNQKRLQLTGKLLFFLKASNFCLINSDGSNLPIKLKIKFDKILIDAPCTGSGTFLSNPELKWRQNEKFLHQNILIQEKLIESALKFLKNNGILIYSTCSLYPEEGELQIMKFREFLEPLAIPKWFSPSYKVTKAELKGTGRLFPAVHNTHGFFVGRFKKKEK